MLEDERDLATVAATLKVGPREASKRVERLAEQVRVFEKEVADLKAKLARGAGGDPAEHARLVNGVKVLATRMDGLDMDTLRATVDHFKDKLQSGVVLLASVTEGKVAFACGVTKDLVGRHKAGDLVKKVAAVCGGSGGGKPEMATAGGKDVDKVDAALEELIKLM